MVRDLGGGAFWWCAGVGACGVCKVCVCKVGWTRPVCRVIAWRFTRFPFSSQSPPNPQLRSNWDGAVCQLFFLLVGGGGWGGGGGGGGSEDALLSLFSFSLTVPMFKSKDATSAAVQRRGPGGACGERPSGTPPLGCVLANALFQSLFVGAIAIGDLVKSTLGPKGMVCCLFFFFFSPPSSSPFFF